MTGTPANTPPLGYVKKSEQDFALLKEQLGNLARQPVKVSSIKFPKFKRFYDNETDTFVYYKRIRYEDWTFATLVASNLLLFSIGVLLGKKL